MKIHAFLNQVFRLVWSQVLNGWFAIAEQIRGRGKDGGRRFARLAAVMALGRLTANEQVRLINPNGITCRDDAWQLQVEPNALDMLLDHLSWGYNLLKFSWMQRSLNVDWR